MNSEFETLYRAYYPKLFRIAAKMQQDTEGAKDVLQDVFTSLYFAVDNKKVIKDLKNWLIRSTINKSHTSKETYITCRCNILIINGLRDAALVLYHKMVKTSAK